MGAGSWPWQKWAHIVGGFYFCFDSKIYMVLSSQCAMRIYKVDFNSHQSFSIILQYILSFLFSFKPICLLFRPLVHTLLWYHTSRKVASQLLATITYLTFILIKILMGNLSEHILLYRPTHF